jgi:hypothetical protein
VVNATAASAIEYSINGGTSWQASNTFTALTPGAYNIQARLQGVTSCITSYPSNPIAINPVPTAPTVSGASVTQPNCATPSGTIVVNASGSGILEYSITNGSVWQTSNVFSNLIPGSYTVVTRLQASPACSTSFASNPVVVTAVPTAPTVSAPTLTQPTCSATNGSIVVNASGSGTLEYSITNGATWSTGATFSGLGAGNYNIVVRSQSTPTCSTTYTSNPVALTIGGIPAISAVSVTQQTCSGVPHTSNGAINITATGTGTIQYSIDNGTSWQASGVFSSLASGSYNVKVRNQSDPTCIATYRSNPVAINPFLNKEYGLCNDGIDNDCDGLIDCQDPDCAQYLQVNFH